MKFKNLFIILSIWFIFDVQNCLESNLSSDSSDIYQKYCLIHGTVYWIICDKIKRVCDFIADPNLAIDFLSFKIKVLNFFYH